MRTKKGEAIQFFDFADEKPQDRQKVWVLMDGSTRKAPVPAVFHTPSIEDKKYEWKEGTFEQWGDRWPDEARPQTKWAPYIVPGVDHGVDPLQLRHVGYDEHRLKVDFPSNGEMVLATEWAQQNDEMRTNGILKMLIPSPTQRDAKVAATIIQWLGTNVGGAFLNRVFRKDSGMADFHSGAVGFRMRSDVRQKQDEDRALMREMLLFIEKNVPGIKKAAPTDDNYLILQTLNNARRFAGLPVYDIERPAEEPA